MPFKVTASREDRSVLTLTTLVECPPARLDRTREPEEEPTMTTRRKPKRGRTRKTPKKARVLRRAFLDSFRDRPPGWLAIHGMRQALLTITPKTEEDIRSLATILHACFVARFGESKRRACAETLVCMRILVARAHAVRLGSEAIVAVAPTRDLIVQLTGWNVSCWAMIEGVVALGEMLT
jgi:hypothetical protein